MSFKGVIFDFDGTLVDTITDIAGSGNYALTQLGYPVHERDAYKYFVGDGVLELMERMLPPEARSGERVQELLKPYSEYYTAHGMDNARPYDGITELLAALQEKGILRAVLSNKPHMHTARLTEIFFPGVGFEAVFGARAEVALKPDPAAALEIAKALGLSPEEMVFVGDTKVDIKTAKAAGMYAVGVLWGFRDAAELVENGADGLIREPGELLELF